MSKSFYSVLGVAESATHDEIKKAYRKLAKQYHPDKNKGDAKAEAKFKEISEAYDILGDEKKRAQYDEMRKAGFFDQMGGQGAAGGRGGWAGAGAQGGGVHGFNFEDLGGFDNIFENLFGGGRARGRSGGAQSYGGFGGGSPYGQAQQRGADITAGLTIPFELAARGGNQTFSFTRSGICPHCHGNGAEPGSGFHVCPQCNGRGTITLGQGGFGIQRTCPQCKGEGQIPDAPCKECRGTGEVTQTRRLTVKIPPGVDDGQTIRIRGEGEQSPTGSGDLLLQITIEPHPFLRREKGKIVSEFTVDLPTAVLGGEVSVPALDGPVRLKLAPGTQPGTVVRLKDKGLYHKHDTRGDHLVTIKVAIPKNLTEEQKARFEAFAETLHHARQTAS